MKRKLIIVSVALALVCAFAVGMTIAYLKATTPTPVKNTFTVGNIEIDIWEHSTDPEATAPVKENEYHIFPGLDYAKDPYVQVKKGSEECYVRMRVELKAESAAAITALTANGKLPQDYVENWDPAVWECKSYVVNGDTISLEFWYVEGTGKIDASQATEDVDLPALFTKVLVPATLDNETLALFDNFKINVYADAIQTAGFASADAAWAAFNPEP